MTNYRTKEGNFDEHTNNWGRSELLKRDKGNCEAVI